jgi:hypothetical protein
MKKHLQKITLLIIINVASLSRANAQNWEYLGNPYINQTLSFSEYLYFADLEFNASGDAFVGYWKYSQKLEFAKFTSGAWTLLPSPGTFPVNNVDIEVKGNNYYLAYSGVRGANSYVFVKKFDGSAWNLLGDSMLIGNAGSSAFDFILDNNEVPTVLGVVSTPLLGEKQIMQFNGSSWVNYFTFSGSAATIFGESSSIFDSQNVLYCNTQGAITSTTVTYFNVTHKIDAGVRSNVGDTLFGANGAHVLKFDAAGAPHLCFQNIILAKTMAYKLTGNSWSFIADTSGSNLGTMLNADLSSNGKFVFNTQGTNLRKSVYIYDNNSRLQMDSLNIQGVGVAAISDIVIPAGSNDVYALVLEIKANVAQDLSVMKHSINGGNSLNEINLTHSFDVYPNPTNGIFTINQNNAQPNTMITVYDALGNMIHTAKMNQSNQQIDLSFAAKGIYFLRLSNDHFQSQRKLIIE